MALFVKIRNADFVYPEWFTSLAKSLLSRILVPDPTLRLSLKEVMQDIWIVNGDAYPETFSESGSNKSDRLNSEKMSCITMSSPYASMVATNNSISMSNFKKKPSIQLMVDSSVKHDDYGTVVPLMSPRKTEYDVEIEVRNKRTINVGQSTVVSNITSNNEENTTPNLKNEELLNDNNLKNISSNVNNNTTTNNNVNNNLDTSSNSNTQPINQINKSKNESRDNTGKFSPVEAFTTAQAITVVFIAVTAAALTALLISYRNKSK